jgi:hypothetical protein
MERSRAAVRWYLFNQRAIAELGKAFGVDTIFVSQPQGPFYSPPPYLTHFFEHIEAGVPKERFVDQLHLLDDRAAKGKPNYVDSAGHYNDAAVEVIVADLLRAVEPRLSERWQSIQSVPAVAATPR